jgi:hypothetical protein
MSKFLKSGMAILNFGMEGALTSIYIRPEAAPGKRKKIKNNIHIPINEKRTVLMPEGLTKFKFMALFTLR